MGFCYFWRTWRVPHQTTNLLRRVNEARRAWEVDECKSGSMHQSITKPIHETTDDSMDQRSSGFAHEWVSNFVNRNAVQFSWMNSYEFWVLASNS